MSVNKWKDWLLFCASRNPFLSFNGNFGSNPVPFKNPIATQFYQNQDLKILTTKENVNGLKYEQTLSSILTDELRIIFVCPCKGPVAHILDKNFICTVNLSCSAYKTQCVTKSPISC